MTEKQERLEGGKKRREEEEERVGKRRGNK